MSLVKGHAVMAASVALVFAACGTAATAQPQTAAAVPAAKRSFGVAAGPSHHIRNEHNGECLTADYRSDNVFTWDCQPDGHDKRWTYDEDTRQIRSDLNGKCLTVKWDGNDVYTWACNDTPDKKWDYSPATSTFRNQRNGECLTVKWGGNDVYTWPCNDTPDKKWHFAD
ncbi:RICIN domain-containing protein [Streptomyces sp. HSW2009]|uniref:RICIN domain-containing protein n=1 Tax=Streptomyces sp. HSW2009 TaxID=3142890 RepID=UPI0032EE624B